MFSKTSSILDFLENHEDERGSILSMVNEKCCNVSLITSKQGSLRGNHYHKTDWHFMYALYGSMEYFFFCNLEKKIKFWNIPKNKIIFTPCNEIHVTYFPVETKIIVVSGYPRDQKTYENDTVRVDFLNNKNLNEAKKGTLNWELKVNL